MYQAVYAFPILPEKTEILRQKYKHQCQGLALYEGIKQDRLAYNQAMGWSACSAWIQKLPEEDLHVLLVESPEPFDSATLCSKFQRLCDDGSATANFIRAVYIETLGRDFYDPVCWVSFEPVCNIEVPYSKEELEGRPITEYAYALPIISTKQESFVAYLKNNVSDLKRFNYFQEVRRKVGIMEIQMWVQHDQEKNMLVMHSKELDTIADFCKSWNHVIENEEIMKNHTDITTDATGLAPHELIADLEQL